MIPVSISYAAVDQGWTTLIQPWSNRAGDTWFTLWHPGSNTTVDVRYTRYRHTRARAYRGTALRAILRGQRQLIDFLGD